MMDVGRLARVMADAGCTGEQVATVVGILLQEEQERVEDRRRMNLERQRRHRAKKAVRAASEALAERPTGGNIFNPDEILDANGTPYAFAMGSIRLNDQTLRQWRKTYTFIDVDAELTSLEDFAIAQGDNWFHAVRGVLNKRNRQAKADHDMRSKKGEGRSVAPYYA